MFACETCFESFKQKAHLEDHMKRKKPCVRSAASQAMIEKKAEELVKRQEHQKLLDQSQEEPSEALLYSWSPSMLSTPVTTPPIKWVGGKTQIIEEVISTMPRRMASYHEPFLGGGSVLLAVLSHRKAKNLIVGEIRASDLNPNVISMYKNIQSNLHTLLTQLEALVTTFRSIETMDGDRNPANVDEAIQSQESFYYWIRKQFNEMTDLEKTQPAASAMMIFLNKTCFRGVYREGPHGFNVPFGHNKNPSVFCPAHLREISELIQPVIFTTASFTQSLQMAKAGDFVYMDPPYYPVAADAFVSYLKGGFKEKDHSTFFQSCHRLTANRIKFSMSNSAVERLRLDFPGPTYMTKKIECKRAINSKNPAAKAEEFIIMNSQPNSQHDVESYTE
jgi:DNA adenine methylase